MSNHEEPTVRRPQSEVPEFYINSFHFACTAWDAHLQFGLRPVVKGKPQPPEPQVIVRMSKEHAWIVCKLMHAVLKRYMRDVGLISIPQDLLKQLELEDEYKADREYVEAHTS